MPSAKRVARSLEREELLGEGHARWRSVVCCGHGDGSDGKYKHDGEAGDGEENGSRVRACLLRMFDLYLWLWWCVVGGGTLLPRVP